MAEKKNAREETPRKHSGTDNSIPKAKADETLYGVDEFVANARELFNTMPECVVAAFSCKGIRKATKEEAQRIVAEFLKREVM